MIFLFVFEAPPVLTDYSGSAQGLLLAGLEDPRGCQWSATRKTRSLPSTIQTLAAFCRNYSSPQPPPRDTHPTAPRAPSQKLETLP